MNTTDRLRRTTAMWRWTGRERPPFADAPEPGQVSVWDFPRPPAVAPEDREVVVRHGNVVVARTTRALKVMETAGAPTVYVPSEDVLVPLRLGRGSSACEWKGRAVYHDVVVRDDVLAGAAWSYASPLAPYELLAGLVAFYPSRLTCTLDDEVVRPQPGGFYGGWVTDELAGPIKGSPGSGGW